MEVMGSALFITFITFITSITSPSAHPPMHPLLSRAIHRRRVTIHRKTMQSHSSSD